MKIKLLDTGYLSATTILTSQGQLSASERAGYTGSTNQSFTMSIESINRSRKVNTESKPQVATYQNVNTSLTSTENENYTVSCILKKEILTTGWNYNNLIQLFRMESTKGLKLLFPTDTGEIDGYRSMVEGFGAVNTGLSPFSSATPTDATGTVGTTIPHMIGRVYNMTLAETAKGTMWRLGFDFEVTG